jgi:signal transduction histidine kinase
VRHDLGLVAALEWLGADLQGAYKVPLTCEAKGVVPGMLDERQRVTLFRSVRELLVNVGKHARARAVHVQLEAAAGRLAVRVEDDGIGFDARTLRAGAFGLSSVRERLGGLGGKMEVRARRGGGTSVVLEVPLGERTEDGRR